MAHAAYGGRGTEEWECDMNERMTFFAFVRRLLQISGLTALSAGRMAVIAMTSKRAARATRLAAELVRLIERLGGAFIKVGQLAGTRVDLVGPTVADALGRLHDNVRPMTARQAATVVRRAFPRPPDGLTAALAHPPVASGSIASVYRVEVGDRVVALKVRRPEIGRAITVDMAILSGMARAMCRLPGLRRVPLAEIIGQVGRCLTDQLDFAAETRSLRQMREHLADFADIIVPAVIPELSGDGVIAMSFVDGLKHASIEDLPSQVREAEVAVLVRAVYRLLFIAGFVHVDLHQGNTYFRPDGTVVLLDAGFAFQMSGLARRRYTEFFGGMIQGDGEACADILRSTVRSVAPAADLAGFRRDVADLVVRNVGATARDFDLPAFCVELFNLQRRYGLYAEPEFIFPMLCLLSLDGLVKEHYPLMDFQLEAAPYVMQSLLSEPEIR
ncbi:ABC1 kinase family protein [Actinomadura alba]|uniref:AarF/ABC1/UbiB kinase family protein n=1 Tax=Actinomadura alba TaxID=406431 RepID=A0ABR7LZN4_9ACTN|nr:AarF/ABC1/UbiB kinase family protein [Actinomadura alba]MBC6470259.1 AarF/ABC1/UbiB kinase family protein [Actinomadura alba]